MLSTHVELAPYPGIFIQNVVMGQRDVLVLSLGKSNFYSGKYLSLLILCTLQMVSFIWLCYNHIIPAPSMHNSLLLVSPFSTALFIYTHEMWFHCMLMMRNTNTDSVMSAVCWTCFCIHNRGGFFIPFCHHYIQFHNNSIFEDDRRNLLIFTSITKTPTMLDMCSLVFWWLTSFWYYWTQCHKNKPEFENILWAYRNQMRCRISVPSW